MHQHESVFNTGYITKRHTTVLCTVLSTVLPSPVPGNPLSTRTFCCQGWELVRRNTYHGGGQASGTPLSWFGVTYASLEPHPTIAPICHYRCHRCLIVTILKVPY